MRPSTAPYAIAITLSSFLLFAVEPMVGKRLLPLLGGSAAVWTTCLVFFQTALLLGYLLAHWIGTRLPPRTQPVLYGALLLLAVAQAAVAFRLELHASTAHPVATVFRLLTMLIGLPFVVLSATGPLLQSWYARRRDGIQNADPIAGSASPYRLFALSNAGSLLALISYPLLVEPWLGLRAQAVMWLAGLLALAIAGTAIVIAGLRAAAIRSNASSPQELARAAPGLRHRLLWLLPALCGSLLLCAMTNHLTQHVAPIPLLWVAPLIVYLLSFVFAFSGETFYPRRVLLWLLAPALAIIAYEVFDPEFSERLQPWLAWSTEGWFAIPILCLALFLACFVCHAELYRWRPEPDHLTTFYLFIATGGALGAFLVGIVGPIVLNANYELVGGLALTAALVVGVTWKSGIATRVWWSAATVAAVVFVIFYVRHYDKEALLKTRDFYGTMRVVDELGEASQPVRALYHGTIVHGNQLAAAELRHQPTTYYGHASGVGLALDLCCGDRPRRVGVIGLGTGTLAAYGRAGDAFRFYEIDSQVERLARTYFTFLADSPARIQVVIGDARLSLAGEAGERFDVLAVDAFAGDAIPVHLLTREAIELYRRHLAPGGILAIHVSNQYIRLIPPVALEAEHAGLPVVAIKNEDDEEKDVFSSDWLLLTANQDFLALTQVREAAAKVERQPLRLWTDDYSTLLPLLTWKRQHD